MEKIPKTAREKYQFEIDNLNLQIKELRDKLNANNAEWIGRCRAFRKQDSDKAEAKYDSLRAAVKALVEAGKECLSLHHDFCVSRYMVEQECDCRTSVLKQAIATTEKVLNEND